jgi:hypothetical protein
MNVTELTEHRKKELPSESKQKRRGILCYNRHRGLYAAKVTRREEINSTLIIEMQGYATVPVRGIKLMLLI